jgi:hypothetical protein
MTACLKQAADFSDHIGVNIGSCPLVSDGADAFHRLQRLFRWSPAHPVAKHLGLPEADLSKRLQ